MVLVLLLLILYFFLEGPIEIKVNLFQGVLQDLDMR